MKKIMLMLLALALLLTPFTALAAEKVTEYDRRCLARGYGCRRQCQRLPLVDGGRREGRH